MIKQDHHLKSKPYPKTGHSSPIPTTLLQFGSLLEMAQYVQTNGNDARAKSATHEVLPVIKEGWGEVLAALGIAEEESQSAFAPVRKQPWGYQGGRISLDRMLAGKPCISRTIKQHEVNSRFVRIVFCGEAMACADSSHFVSKCADLLAFIRRAEGKGQRIELWGAWGGVLNLQIAGMTFTKIKAFGEAINLPILSAIGHETILRTLQFSTEEMTMPRVGNAAICTREAYVEMLSHLIGEEQAKTAHVCIKLSDIDPQGWIHDKEDSNNWLKGTK